MHCATEESWNRCSLGFELFCDLPAGYSRLYAEAAQRLEELGGMPVVIDFEPFATAAGLLYTSAFLAERYSGVREFLEAKQVCMHVPLKTPRLVARG